jgi:hypothetical protein
MRVRGSIPESFLNVFAEVAPHPNLLPASGEKEQIEPAVQARPKLITIEYLTPPG